MSVGCSGFRRGGFFDSTPPNELTTGNDLWVTGSSVAGCVNGLSHRALRLIRTRQPSLLTPIATRYDKTARNFLTAIHLIAALCWLN